MSNTAIEAMGTFLGRWASPEEAKIILTWMSNREAFETSTSDIIEARAPAKQAPKITDAELEKLGIDHTGNARFEAWYADRGGWYPTNTKHDLWLVWKASEDAAKQEGELLRATNPIQPKTPPHPLPWVYHNGRGGERGGAFVVVASNDSIVCSGLSKPQAEVIVWAANALMKFYD